MILVAENAVIAPSRTTAFARRLSSGIGAPRMLQRTGVRRLLINLEMVAAMLP
jgi:hypothetical protein